VQNVFFGCELQNTFGHFILNDPFLDNKRKMFCKMQDCSFLEVCIAGINVKHKCRKYANEQT